MKQDLTLGPRAWRLPVAIPSWREKRDGVFPLPEPYFWSLHGECPTFRPMCQRSRIISCRAKEGPRGSGLDSCIKPELHETRPDPRSSLVLPVAGLLDNWVLGGQIGVIGWCKKMRLLAGRIQRLQDARPDPKIFSRRALAVRAFFRRYPSGSCDPETGRHTSA